MSCRILRGVFHFRQFLFSLAKRTTKKKKNENLYTVIKLNVYPMLQHKSQVNYHVVYRACVCEIDVSSELLSVTENKRWYCLT